MCAAPGETRLSGLDSYARAMQRLGTQVCLRFQCKMLLWSREGDPEGRLFGIAPHKTNIHLKVKIKHYIAHSSKCKM
jgi:hypothetical protein